MTNRIEIELTDGQAARLGRMAERLGGTPNEAGAALIEESLRETEFPWIDFRDSVVGRQAYCQGSGMAVWEVVMIARDFGMDAERVAQHLSVPLPMVQGALRYTAAYPDEIYGALAENDAYDDFETARRGLPDLVQYEREDEVASAEQGTAPEKALSHAATAAR